MKSLRALDILIAVLFLPAVVMALVGFWAEVVRPILHGPPMGQFVAGTLLAGVGLFFWRVSR